jgi:prolyl oligopeptidase
MLRRTPLGLCALTGLLVLSSVWAVDGPYKYPQARRGDVTDNYHGTKVADPYRWLEDDVRKSPEVEAWVKAQNEVTDAYLKEIPEREAIRKKLTELWNYEKISAPFKVGGKYFFRKNDGLQNQDVVYVMETLDSKPRVLLDPNGWTKDGTMALAGMAFSDDGKFLAYGVAEAGSDWNMWKVLHVPTGKVLDDEIRWCKFAGADWTKDGKGFFYGRFPEPKAGEKFQSLNMNQKIYYHRIGTPQSEDVLVYERPDQPKWGFNPNVSEDGKYLIITCRVGTDARHRIFYKDLEEPFGMVTELIGNFEHEYSFVGNDGPVFYFKTNHNAPMGRLVAIDTQHPETKDWKEIIPQAKESLQGVHITGNLFIATYLKDAKTQVKMFDIAGKFVREVQFPGIGTAAGFGGKRSETETFYTFSSFAVPPTIYKYDLITGKQSLYRKTQVKFNPDDYTTTQVFFKSKDGAKVPMFITHKKGIKLDGTNPTLLYGYGGFNISLTPSFSPRWLSWMELGGVFAQANLRGGGEYGKDWHKAGTKERKQNVFNDFIGAAEWLIENGYTKPEKLAIMGGSNGGLLVGACMTQRPDLFGACLPAVGVMDMLRFHKFTAGRYWTDDYGCADNAEDFKYLHAYSPYHNLKPGTKYPPTLVTTADTDDRVVPGHSFKFTAQLQHCQAGPAPVMARIETRAGHGAGKPTAKQIAELTDEWAFLVKNLKMTLPQ